MNKNFLLLIGVGLIVLGLWGNSSGINIPLPVNNVETLKIDPPQDEALLGLANSVTTCLANGSEDRKEDGMRLASLYKDMSVLIALDDEVIKSTNAIAQANVMSAKLLQINLKGKYPGLAEAADNLFKNYVSDKTIPLDDDLREKAVEAFEALAWGCLQGAK